MGKNGVMEWGREALCGNGQGSLVTGNRVGDNGLRMTAQGVQLWRRCSVYDRETPRFAEATVAVYLGKLEFSENRTSNLSYPIPTK